MTSFSTSKISPQSTKNSFESFRVQVQDGVTVARVLTDYIIVACSASSRENLTNSSKRWEAFVIFFKILF